MTILDDIADAARTITDATDQRDSLIRRAINEGTPVTQIAKAATLSRERIYQIRDGRR